MKKSKLWLGLSSVGILLTTMFLAITSITDEYKMLINDLLGIKNPYSDSALSSYAKDGKLTDEGCMELIKDSYDFCVQEEREGSVLLKNKDESGNPVLPLAENERSITIFGGNSANMILRSGAGGAAPNNDLVVHLNEAFELRGFEVNPTVWDLNKTAGYPDVGNIKELAKSKYTNEIKQSYETRYNDAAVVTFTRAGTENEDPKDGILDLDQNEKDLLTMIKDSGKFSKTIVLLNSAMPMSCNWVDDPAYGVDAVLFVGVPGYYSLAGVVDVLMGKAGKEDNAEKLSPSGHAPDTFSAHASNSAAYQNFGNIRFGGNPSGDYVNGYVVYKEGIYVGYKYYETRYEDCILGRGNANGNAGCYDGETNWTYNREVAFPFGFGLSYTKFKQTIEEVTLNTETDQYEVKVKVENIGDYPAKSSVQIYAQLPYTTWDVTNKIEKSAIQLCGYEKTGVLAPFGEENSEETVTVKFDRYFLASYDWKVNRQYFLEAGDYYFAVGNGAHEALNNVLALKGATGLVDHDGKSYTAEANTAIKVNVAEDYTTFKKSHYSNTEVTNRFDDADLNYWCDNQFKFEYLTRNDWQTTFPTKLTGLTINSRMQTGLNMSNQYTRQSTEETYASLAGKEYNRKLKDADGNSYKIYFKDMVDIPLHGDAVHPITGEEMDGADIWEEFVSQMSLNEMAISMLDNRGISAVEKVLKPDNSVTEGPEGLLATFQFGDKRKATGFATGAIYSGSWDHEIQRKFGDFYAEECLFCGVACVNAPGCNINRTPYGSRASEYMSEDGIFNYYCAANIVGAARKKGLIMNIKHCFLNNQETNRQGVATYCNEQAIREIYLKPFEGALTKGESLGIMTSYNRIGCTYAACHKTLVENVLRGEWGYEGFVIDDALQGERSGYTNTKSMLNGGTQMFCLDGNRGIVSAVGDDVYLFRLVKQANKNIMYAMLQSSMKELSVDEALIAKNKNPWWRKVIVGADIAVATLTAAAIVMFALTLLVFNKKEKKDEEVVA